VNNLWHGPTGRWYNGAACDYYGKYGLYAWNQFSSNDFYNYGIFRLMVGGRGNLKALSDVEYSYNGLSGIKQDKQLSAGGSMIDQINAQGYQGPTDLATYLPGSDMRHASWVRENTAIIWQPTYLGFKQLNYSGFEKGYEFQFGKGLAGYWQKPGKINGLWTHAAMVEGLGMVWDVGQLHPVQPVPPLNMKWEGYLDNYLDESAVNLFANGKHASNKKVGLCSLIKSITPFDSGGEGRDGYEWDALSFGPGVRSLNIFELGQLV